MFCFNYNIKCWQNVSQTHLTNHEPNYLLHYVYYQFHRARSSPFFQLPKSPSLLPALALLHQASHLPHSSFGTVKMASPHLPLSSSTLGFHVQLKHQGYNLHSMSISMSCSKLLHHFLRARASQPHNNIQRQHEFLFQ